VTVQKCGYSKVIVFKIVHIKDIKLDKSPVQWCLVNKKRFEERGEMEEGLHREENGQSNNCHQRK
jgi:hypothetical protein